MYLFIFAPSLVIEHSVVLPQEMCFALEKISDSAVEPNIVSKASKASPSLTIDKKE